MNISKRFSLSLLFVALAGCGADSDDTQSVDSTLVTNPPATPVNPPVTNPATPATPAPTESTPTTQEPVTEQPVTEEPVSEQPVTEEPASEEPTQETPATEEPTQETPAAVDPTPEVTPPTQTRTDAVSILSSPGTFDSGFEGFNVSSPESTSANEEASFDIASITATNNPWDIQLWHSVIIENGKQYTVCYNAKADVAREIEVNIDDNDPTFASVLGEPFNGGVTQNLTTSYQAFSYTFTANKPAPRGRLTFNMAQTNGNVQIDDIGVFEGESCGIIGSTTAIPEAAPGWTIEKIGCNDPDDYNGAALTLFEGGDTFDGTFGNKEFETAEFANLSRQGAQDYVLTDEAVADASCDQRKVHSGTWLKKLANTDSQHSNFMNKFEFGTQTFGDIESVVIELRINSALTDVPTREELVDQYGSVISENGIDVLDNNRVTFGLTLGDPDATDEEIRGEAFIDIDQELYRDQWIRITIPRDAFFYWQNQNWVKTPVALEDAEKAVPTRIAFLPETKGSGSPATHGSTVRNVFGFNEWETLEPKPVEDFKEMNISIRTFEVRFEPTPVGGLPEPAPVEPAPTEPAPAEPVGVSTQEAQQRIAAGQLIYENENICTVCHGVGGTGGAFGSIIVGLENNLCDTCSTSYDDLVDIITTGIQAVNMPACAPAGNCATQIADYVWGGLNNNALPVINN